jgi:hypothetical protein
MNPRSALILLCAWLPLLAGCGSSDDSSATPAQAGAAKIEFIEASGIAVRGGGRAAVIGGDESPDRLWGVSLANFDDRWELPYPAGTPLVDDVEGCAPWGTDQLFVISSQSRTKPRAKAKPERERLALVTLSPDARQIVRVQVHDGLRDQLIAHLVRQPRDVIENPVALTDSSPVNGGLNVEGIAAWRGRLLIGLRCPAGRRGAIVVPLRYPEKLFGQGAEGNTPDFDPVMIVPADPGEGIRDMVMVDDNTIYVILGTLGEGHGPGFRVIQWNPTTGETKKLRVPGLKDIKKPEGIAVDPQGRLLIVQDLLPPIKVQVLYRLEIEPEKKQGAVDGKPER